MTNAQTQINQNHLNDIHDRVMKGRAVDGWGGARHSDMNTLVEGVPPNHRLYARKLKDGRPGPWIEIP